MSDFLTVEEVADKIHTGKRNVQRLCRDGVIGSTRSGRRYLIPPESLDNYLNIVR